MFPHVLTQCSKWHGFGVWGAVRGGSLVGCRNSLFLRNINMIKNNFIGARKVHYLFSEERVVVSVFYVLYFIYWLLETLS